MLKKLLTIPLFLFTSLICPLLASGEVVKWAQNGAPVSSDAASKLYPSITGDKYGGAFVVWEDYRNVTGDIFVQRIDINGTPVFAGDKDATVDNTSDKRFPAIVKDGSGGAFVVWEDDRNGASNTDIYIQRINAIGEPVWAEDMIVCNAQGSQWAPRIALTNTGDAIIVWEDHRGAFSQIYAQMIDSDGNPKTGWTVNGAAVAPYNANQSYPAISSDGSTGAVIVWEDWRNISSSGIDIYGQLINSDGAGQWLDEFGNKGKPVTIANGDQWVPAIATDGNNSFVVTWEDLRDDSGFYSNIYANVINLSGVPLFATDKAVSSAPEDQRYPTIAYSTGEGSFIILWEDYRNDPENYTADIYARKITSAGAFPFADAAVSTAVNSQEDAPAITGSDTAGVIAAWEDSRINPAYDIYALSLPIPGSIMIDNDAVSTTITDVTLTLWASGIGTTVNEMRISNDGVFDTEPWETYTGSISWTLTAGEGTKTVYAQFKDNDENLSPVYFDEIALSIPSGTVSINSGAEFTKNSSVTLTISATNVTQMCVSNTTSCSSWEPYATSKGGWPLASGDGTKTVHVQFKDQYGNISTTSDDIILDRTPPSGTVAIKSPVSIKDGITYTNSLTVTLEVSATDAGSGPCVMVFSNDKINWGGWSECNYATTTSWTLSSGDGAKTVYVAFRDNIGNWSSFSAPTASNSVILDTVNPTNGTLSATASDSNQISLNWSGFSDSSSGIGSYKLVYSTGSAPATCSSGTQVYSGTATSYTHTGLADNIYYYRVCAVDNAGNTSSGVTASAVIDTTAPTDGTLLATASGSQVSLSWSGFSDATSGIGAYKLVYSTGSAPTNCSSGTQVYSGTDTSYTHTGLADSTYYYRLCAVDIAQNTSTGATANAIVDTVRPTGSITINNGAAYTTSATVTLNLSASDSIGVTGYYISASSTIPAASDSGWTPITSTTSYIADLSYPLSGGDETKTLYVWYKDSAGNISTTFSKSITLDSAAPTDGTLSATASGSQVSLSWSGFSDATSGIGSYKLVYSTGSAPTSCSSGTQVYSSTGTSYTHTGLADDTYYYRLCAVDIAGNTSSGATTSATTDTTASTGSVSINNGAAYTISESVTLNLSASDSIGVTGYYISTSPTIPLASDLGWTSITSTTSYNDDIPYSLSVGDGTKTVYVWYKDAADDVSTTFSKSIMLDATAPADGTLSATASGSQVLLSWSGFSDATSGIGNYKLVYSTGSAPANCSSGTQVYAGSGTSYTHTGLADNTYYYRVCALDNAGNTSSGTTTSATTDTTASTGSVSINNGAAYTTSESVTLNLSASDSVGVTGYYVSTSSSIPSASDPGWAPITSTTSYNDDIPYSLSVGDGTKIVYVWYKDWAGNVSTTFSKSITLDMTPPTGSIIINNGVAHTNSTSVTLSLLCTDEVSGCSQMEFSNDNSSWSIPETFESIRNWSLDSVNEAKTFYVRFKDSAGNLSVDEIKDTITLDTTPPTVEPPTTPAAGATRVSLDTTISITFSEDVNPATLVSEIEEDVIANPPTTVKIIRDVSHTVILKEGENIVTPSPAATFDSATKTLYLEPIKHTTSVPYFDRIPLSEYTTYTVLVTTSVMDIAGNPMDAPYSFSFITADITKPSSTISSPSNGSNIGNTITYTITGVASDSGSGVSKVEVSTDGGATWSDATGTDSWSYTWTLPADGTYVLKSMATDSAGNIEDVGTGITVIVDNAAPTGAVAIDNGASFTNSLSITLTLTASTDTTNMRFSTDGSSWKGWETYSESISYRIPSGDGTKTVYVQFRDAVGNISSLPYSDDIILDTTPPDTGSGTTATISIDGALTASGQTSYSYSKVVASWTPLSDATAGLKEYKIAIGTSSGGTDILDWTGTAVPSYTTGDISSDYFGKTLYISVKAIDNLGTESSILSASFVYTPADINSKSGGGDGRVDGFDLGMLGIAFGSESGGVADINRDGKVDGIDLTILGINFGKVRP